jgi:ubiquinone/menaquinone biosynthesis C-methylase UbiE
MLDIRPLDLKIDGLSFTQADCTNMSSVPSGSITSISALHSIEHFGLGRYGDQVDPLGYRKAFEEIQRVVAKGGDIYISVPIGRQRLEFNAHRIFDPKYIVRLFQDCQLIKFSAVDDKNEYCENADMDAFLNSDYSCGLFHFRKG